MKRKIIILLAVITLFFSLSFSAFSAEGEISAESNATDTITENDENTPAAVFVPSADDITGKVEVISKGEVVSTFEVITNNKTFNARDPLQKALRYAQSNASEADIYTVTLPKGTYYFYSSLDIYSNTCLDLNGSTIYRAGSCAALLRFGEKADVSYGYDGYKNITVKNGEFNGNTTGKTSLVRFAHASNISFDNLTFTNTKGVQHLLTFAASSDISITNCTFSKMQITDDLKQFNCEAVQIDILKDGHFHYPAHDGTPTKNVTVTGCTFENLQRGIGTHSAFANHYFDNITITDNTFKNIIGYAVNAINYINSVISRNTITNCGSGINCGTVTNESLLHFYGPVNESNRPVSQLNVEITDNNIILSDENYEHVAYGINLIGKNIKNYKDNEGKVINHDYRISGVTVTGNTITSHVSTHNFYGIQIDGAYSAEGDDLSSLNIKNNTVTITCNDAAVKANYGIRALNCTNVNIVNNTVSDNGEVPHLESGIRLEDSTGCHVDNNAVTKTTSFGIKLTNAKKSTIHNNTLKEIAADGIYIFSGCDSITVENNLLYSPQGYGIYVRDSKLPNINDNKIYTPKNIGIYLTGKATVKKIYNNLLSGLNNHGIYLNENSSSTSVYDNSIDITNKEAIGIYLINKASVGTIENNKINLKESKESQALKVTSKAGITINSKSSATTSIKNNNIRECTEAGITIFAIKSDSSLVITKNTLINTVKGVYVSSSSTASEVSSNDIRGATEYGVYVNSNASAKTIKDNKINIEKATAQSPDVICKSGITVNSKSSATSVIKNNRIKGCSESGITVFAVKSDANLVITNNTLTNTTQGIYLSNTASASEISSNNIYGATEYGVYVNINASVKTIKDNNLNWEKADPQAPDVTLKAGININSKSSATSVIKNNRTKNCSESGIIIYAVKNDAGLVISENTLTNTIKGIYMSNSASASEISSNKISGATEYGIYLIKDSSAGIIQNNTINTESSLADKKIKSGITINSKSSATKIIKNNNMKGCNTAGIIIYAINPASKAVISGNTVINTIKGIYLSNTSSVSEISSNYIAGANDHGIYLNKDASAAKISGNTVDIINKDSIGVYLINNASAGTIDSNIINAKGSAESKDLQVTCKNGITLNSKKCALTSLSGNTIKGCTDNAIVLFALSSEAKPQINNNTLIMGTGMGIYISANVAVSTVSSNYICGSTAHGIYLNKSASASSIKENTIDVISKTASGIKIFDQAHVSSITSNVINACEKEESKLLTPELLTGIEINSKKCKLKSIKNNEINGASETGIVLITIKSGATPSVSGNKIIKPKRGIYLTNIVKCSTVTSNYICGSKDHGIYLNQKASASSISKNTIDVISKSANGICLTGDSTASKINNNTINAKKKTQSKKLKIKCNMGIYINSKSCKITEITGNTVTKCSDSAICVYKSKSKPTISKNKLSSSSYGIRYKKAKVKSNTFTKCSKAKSKKL